MNDNKKILIIAAVTLLLVIGVFLWMVILNKGRLVISGDPSYVAEVIGDSVKAPKRVSCSSDPCILKLPAGAYNVTLTKPDYRDELRSVQIERRGTTDLSIDFEFIPVVRALAKEEAAAVLDSLGKAGDLASEGGSPSENEDLASLFRFNIDPTYKKQRLIYQDPESDESKILVYFDRTLGTPQVFPHPDLNRVLVSDQATGALYLINGDPPERSLLGEFKNVKEVLWSEGTPWFLLRTENKDDAQLWFVNASDNSHVKWLFSFGLEKVAWKEGGQLVFASRAPLDDLEGTSPSSTVDALKSILGDDVKPQELAFVIGEYDVNTGMVRTLIKIARSLGVAYEDVSIVFYEGRLLMIAGEQVFEVVR